MTIIIITNKQRIGIRCTLIYIMMVMMVMEVSAMKYEDHIEFSSQYNMFRQFGYNQGGSYSVDILIDSSIDDNNIIGGGGNSNFGGGNSTRTTTTPTLTFWLCQDNSYMSLIGSSGANAIETELCANPSAGRCDVAGANITQDGFSISGTVSADSIYRFIILKCNSSLEVELSLRYTLINPDGHQLPRGYLQLPSVYLAMVILYAFLSSQVLIYVHRNKPFTNNIHTVLEVVLLLRMILITLVYIYWRSADVNGYFSPALRYLQNIFYALAETSFFAALLFLAKGWKITRAVLYPLEVRTIVIILWLLMALLLFFSFYNDVYYLLSLMILYFFMMPKLFSNFTKNIRVLETQIAIARTSNQNGLAVVYSMKKRAFKYMRTAVVLYLCGILIANCMRIIIVWHLYWITFCLAEIISLIAISFLWIIFRPFQMNPLFINSNVQALTLEDLTQMRGTFMNLPAYSTMQDLLMSLTEPNYDPTSCIVVRNPSGYPIRFGIPETELL
ncbi:hypothetical protein SAMD00019534_034010, partial [Acytostelium subglobosum LB1]|uniref:hypothetical protein n=1 Tax=Acytostelium subglobosum LB1 TaxID=1410327 RepID=UPI000644B64E